MKVPLSWLREFVDVSVEPRRLADDLTLVGLAVDALETHGTETVLDIDVTTNRVDCMNVYGVAREAAVIYGLPLRPLDTAVAEVGPPASEALDVAIDAPDLCPRFCARVLDVRIGQSPEWLRDRLELVGVRPLSNIVDLTNYVMMEMGQPSHAFDLARIPMGRLRIRWALDGERLTTLDGVARSLTSRIGVVAGPEEALGLAGIMGGASSEVGGSTRTVALEAAHWEPLAIRRGAKALGMHTEASHRFERRADPEGPVTATARIGHLLAKIGVGSVRPGLIDRVAKPRSPRAATLRSGRMSVLLGTEVPEAQAHHILGALGFVSHGSAEGGAAFEIPTWRGDVAREADLIEEVGRHWGINRIPSTVPPAREGVGLRPFQSRERRLRDLLVGAGLTEVMSYSFVSDAAAGSWVPPRVRIANPLAQGQEVLRNSLVIPGLIEILKHNLRRGRGDVAVFELGRVFLAGADADRHTEERRLGILLGGARPPHWSAKPCPFDFFDAKGILEVVGRALGREMLFSTDGLPPFLHPGQASAIVDEGQTVGYVGALHPDAAGAWDTGSGVFVAEVRIEALLAQAVSPVRVRPLPRFPAISRDLSIVCDAAQPSREVLGWIRSAAGSSLVSLAVLDRYTGRPVPEGNVSLTVTLRFEDPERTLTGDEVQASIESVIRELRRRGVEIRGE